MRLDMSPFLKPRSVKAAALYIGTTLKKWWDVTDEYEAGWFKCTVIACHDETENVDGEIEKGLQVRLR